MRRPAAALLLLIVASGCATTPAREHAALPAPPAEGALVDAAAGACPATRPGEADVAVLLWEQETRTPDEVARAASEVDLTAEAFAGEVGGPVLERRPLTAALLRDALDRSGPLYRAVKERCRRARPYLADARIHPAVVREESFSYPSGHATRGALMGRLLAALAPARADALVARGRQIGWDRVRGGVHFPTDVAAGQRIADALADRWLADPAFAARVAQARAAEWAAR